MLAEEGYPIIGVVVVAAAGLAFLGVRLGFPWSVLLVATAVAGLAFTLWFFRDPTRTIPDNSEGRLLLAPADGKVIIVGEVEFEPLYLKSPARQISIFLSPLNVHVNRSPASGVVEYDEYVAGKYLVAWHPKSSELNERSQLGIRHPSGRKILFKQIAGAVARRVVYHITVGDSLSAGQRYGIVRFGSRMDVLVPVDVELSVAVGDAVTAGETIIGVIPSGNAAAGPDRTEHLR